jgi:predicted AlkP superfamily pyrophosphatase or phosphodiesterase
MKTALVLAALLGLAVPTRQPVPPRTHLVIVVDGLRPDYVTPDVMPRLVRLSQRGTSFTAHHSVFPTVTRVNAATFVTGTYPETHGLLGNTIYVPRANAIKGLDTGQRENLEAVERADGRLLTAPTLSEILRPAGKSLLVVSSGSTGVSWILNHTLATGGIVHPLFTRPPELATRVTRALGTAPAHATPNDPQNQYTVDAYLKLALEELHPDVTFMWLSDPDSTAHTHGIGSPLTRQSLSLVDGQIGRVEDALRARGLLDRTNIIVVSDHGFSTHTGELKLAALVEPFARPLPDGSPDIVVAEGAVHFRSASDPARVAAVVAALQKHPEVGAIFTRPRPGGGSEGVVPGTLSFDIARWYHPDRSGDVLVSENWTDRKNATGFAGTTTDSGAAGHGSTSPYDMHNTLIAAGPDFREHAESQVPTGNVDVAPTLVRLLGLDVPKTMTGRVIEEGLRSGPSPVSIRVAHSMETVRTADGSYELTAHISTVGGRRYLDYTVVRRPRLAADRK